MVVSSGVLPAAAVSEACRYDSANAGFINMARLPRANLIQGSVSPAQPGMPAVPLDDPLLATQIAGSESIRKKLDAFSRIAFEMAGKTAKGEGAAYGARSAPTVEQVRLARETGQTVDMPGDPSSISLFEQAAYAGSLAVTESRFTASGRRELTNAMAAAAQDPSMTPQEFSESVDSIVTEYSNIMSTISPTSGAKVNAALSLTANGQLSSFSRTWVTNERKKVKNQGHDDFQNIIAGLGTAIDGYSNFEVDDEAGTSLREYIDSLRYQAEAVLENSGWTSTQVLTRMKIFDKAVHDKLRGTIVNSINQQVADTDDLDGLNRLRSGTADPKIQDLYNSLSPGEKNKVQKDIATAYSAHRSALGFEERQQAAAADRAANVQKRILATTDRNSPEHKRAHEALIKIDPDDARAWQTVTPSYPAFDHELLILSLERDIDNPVEDIKIQDLLNPDYTAKIPETFLARLVQLRDDNHITSTTYERIRKKIISLQDTDFKNAMLKAKAAFGYETGSSLDMTNARVQTAHKNYTEALATLSNIYKLQPEADLQHEITKIIKDLKPEPETRDSVYKTIGSILDLTVHADIDARIKLLRKDTRKNVMLLRQLKPHIKKLKELKAKAGQ
jgi:hypothetical protein